MSEKKRTLEERFSCDVVIPFMFSGNALDPRPVEFTIGIPRTFDTEPQRVGFRLNPWTQTDSANMRAAGVDPAPRDYDGQAKWCRYIVHESPLIDSHDPFYVPIFGDNGHIVDEIEITDTPEGRENLLQLGSANLLQTLFAKANELVVQLWVPPEEEGAEGADPRISGHSSDGAIKSGQSKGKPTKKQSDT